MEEFAAGQLIPATTLIRHLKSCGRSVKIFRGCRLVPAEAIRVGDFSQIDEGVCVFAGEEVVIGCHVHMAIGSSITGGGRCVIGDFAGIGAGVRLITGSEEIDGSGLTNPTVPASHRAVRRGSVLIGEHAVIFTNSVILPDVEIGMGAVVAAGSLVHRDLKPWGIYGGNPLVQIGTRPSESVLRLARELTDIESGVQP